MSDSNIGVVFIPTGFPKNRSRFLKQITEEEATFSKNVIELEDKEGKFYVEKPTWIEKYVGRDSCMKDITYSQFVKRYTATKIVPKGYIEQNYFLIEMDMQLDQTDIDNEDYIFDGTIPNVGEKGKKLPKYFMTTVSNGECWMHLRKPIALRLHKFKRTTDTHEFCYSELQLYKAFRKESELLPDDAQECIRKYYHEVEHKRLLEIKSQVMKHVTDVEEGRARAEEVILNEIGNTLDPNKEQQDEDALIEGIV